MANCKHEHLSTFRCKDKYCAFFAVARSRCLGVSMHLFCKDCKQTVRTGEQHGEL